MKKLLNWFPSKKVMGASADDLNRAKTQILAEFCAARDRQKSPNAEPTKYMQGLQKALDILDAVQPRNLMEV